MDTSPSTEGRDQVLYGSLRGRLLFLASVFAILALLHFADHAIRGELVVRGGLNPNWNHSGWPFNTQSDKPYVFPVAFIVVFGLVLGGIFFTLRGRLWAGYWLATSIALFALLVFVHFVGFEPNTAETPQVIAMSYPANIWRVLALIDLFSMFAILIALAVQAVRTRQGSGHW